MTFPSGTSLASRVRLNQGPEIPWLGLGVFQTEPGAVTRKSVTYALDAGYRAIDTAAMYGNEADVGEAVRASHIPREDVFVTTKLWYTEHGYESALRAGRSSAERLGLGAIDLYLIHWPRADSPQDRLDTWRAMSELQRGGLCRAIGVSNYTVRHLEELRTHSDVVPAVDQVEFHPFVFNPELLDYCTAHGIRLEAWSPLTRGRHMDHPTIAAIAAAHHRTSAQVLIRWGLEHGVIEIPKSTHRERILENAQVFDFALTDAEVAALDALKGGPRVGMWNPADIP
ncbi:MAG TPA: aldo/keto reductase [Thermoplasmata archaeon]|jgi:diketogulonate reductase-like aldo/keto reductase|nr:aldo/keto reductase [Thermoplasmata archaeon]